MCCSYCIATQWDVCLTSLWLIQASPLITDSHGHACYVCRLDWIIVSSVFCFHLQVFPDNAAGREIASLPARCLNQDCSWTGSIKQYEVREKSWVGGGGFQFEWVQIFVVNWKSAKQTCLSALSNHLLHSPHISRFTSSEPGLRFRTVRERNRKCNLTAWKVPACPYYQLS